MQITFDRALKSIIIGDDTANAVVDDLEDFVKGRMEDAIKPLESSIDALRSQLTLFSILIFVTGLLIAAGPTIAKLVP